MNSGKELTLSSQYEQTFQVPFHFPVSFTQNAFDPQNQVLADLLLNAREDGPTPKVRAWFDEGLVQAQPDLPRKIQDYFAAKLPDYTLSEPAIYPGGEAAKEAWAQIHPMLDDLSEHHLCRHSYLIAVGGGAFLDAAGFAAAMLHRGIRLVRFPSTVLSQDDSGIGVKNGINLKGSKNFLGTFAPPFAVVNDLNLLRTLPPEIMRDGLSEAYKVAIIKDKPFFDFLSANAEALNRGEASVLNETVKRCAILHLQHIAMNGDPFEMGSARPLDFGHWAAHRLESMSGYSIRHGQAVSIGIALDSWYAAQKGLITENERDAVLNALERTGLPIYHPLLSKQDKNGHFPVLDGIEQFREHLGGILCVTLPDGLGKKIEVSEIDRDLIISGIKALATRG